MIDTIGKLKELIKGLPDDMPVAYHMVYNQWGGYINLNMTVREMPADYEESTSGEMIQALVIE